MAKRTTKRLPKFVPFDSMRWHSEISSILVTAEQVIEGLFRMKAQRDVPETPLNVAAVLLMRLEDMRADTKARAANALAALYAGDEMRARMELAAIAQNVEQRIEGYHGICVTHDMRFHGARSAA